MDSLKLSAKYFLKKLIIYIYKIIKAKVKTLYVKNKSFPKTFPKVYMCII